MLFAVVAVTSAALPLSAWAHQLGITYLDLTLDHDDVRVRIALDPHDTPLATHIDSDGDGVISEEELQAGQSALTAFTFGRVLVTTPDGACVQSPLRTATTEPAVWQASADYRCPSRAIEAAIVVGFLSAMPSTHRAVVRIISAGVLQQETLDPTHDTIPARQPRPSRWHQSVPIVGTAALVVIALWLSLRKRHRAVSD